MIKHIDNSDGVYEIPVVNGKSITTINVKTSNGTLTGSITARGKSVGADNFEDFTESNQIADLSSPTTLWSEKVRLSAVELTVAGSGGTGTYIPVEILTYEPASES